jgi:hypothetical protein
MNNTRIMFLRNSKCHPVGCIAINFDRSEGKIDYQVSVLHPQDRFNRAVGRKLAIDRLLNKPISIKVNKEASMHDISTAVLKDLSIRKGTFPNRVIKSANMWLTHKTKMNTNFKHVENSLNKVRSIFMDCISKIDSLNRG